LRVRPVYIKLFLVVALASLFLTVQNTAPVYADTIAISVAATEDDAAQRQDGTNFSYVITTAGTTSAQVNPLGGSSDQNGTSAFRFDNVTIPEGAIINTATLGVNPTFAGDNYPYLDIYLEDTDDAVDFATNGTITGRTKTTAVAQWRLATSVPVSSNASTQSADFASVLQEVVDRPGWTSGNAVVVIMWAKNVGSSPSPTDRGDFIMKAFGYGGVTQQTTLNVDFTAAPSVTTSEPPIVSATTATAEGNITSTGGENPDLRGFVYGTTSQSDPGNIAPGSSGYDSSVSESGSFSTGTYTDDLTDLTASTTYYVRAFSHNAAGYTYGSEQSFVTASGETLSTFLQDMIVGAAVTFVIVFLVIFIKPLGNKPENLFLAGVIGFVMIIVYLNLGLVR
jgi:hypothetical protein